MKLLSKEEVIDALERHPFQFAKTMPDIPHSYTLKKNWEDKELFESVVAHMRIHGKVGKWRQYCNIYFYTDKHKYWTMGNSIEETILINRADIDANKN